MVEHSRFVYSEDDVVVIECDVSPEDMPSEEVADEESLIIPISVKGD